MRYARQVVLLSMLVGLFAGAPLRAGDNMDLIQSWPTARKNCESIANFKRRFGSQTAYAEALAARSKELKCGKPPEVVRHDSDSGTSGKGKRNRGNRNETGSTRPVRYLPEPPPPSPSPPPDSFELGTAAAARGEHGTARYYFGQACKNGNAMACNKAAGIFETDKDYSSARDYHEQSCLRAAGNDTWRKIYCNNASVVYLHRLYGNSDATKAANYYATSGMALSERTDYCNNFPADCEILLSGLAAPNSANIAKARELAEWLCWSGKDNRVASNACLTGSRLRSGQTFRPIYGNDRKTGLNLAQRGCETFSNLVACLDGLQLAGSDFTGTKDLRLARYLFEKSLTTAFQLDCKTDSSVCQNLGIAYSNPYLQRQVGPVSYGTAATLFAKACKAANAAACMSAAMLYERTDTGLKNASYASFYRQEASKLGCNFYGQCPQSRGF